MTNTSTGSSPKSSTIVFRTPCEFHKNCNETAVLFLHGRSAKDGPITEEEWEKGCWVCERTLREVGISLKSTGKWTCPKCGFVHTCDVANRGPCTPVLSKWYRALECTPQEDTPQGTPQSSAEKPTEGRVR